MCFILFFIYRILMLKLDMFIIEQIMCYTYVAE